MAESKAHKFGQIIGDLLEIAIGSPLEEYAKHNRLFLDKKGSRATRKGKKLSWTDSKNNVHDLDFVLERNGTKEILGTPVAFIEIAWRRYTKHSRNKAQEIQGAILPLAEKYKNHSPFIGVVLAGEFTEGALNQLKSSGFSVLYFPYKSVIKAFRKYGIDASSDQTTSEKAFDKKIKSWQKNTNKNKIGKELLRLNRKEVETFLNSLDVSISRFIEVIRIFPLHGLETLSSSVNEAISLIENYQDDQQRLPLARFEINIRYNNGDKIDGIFQSKNDAIEFLKMYQ